MGLDIVGLGLVLDAIGVIIITIPILERVREAIRLAQKRGHETINEMIQEIQTRK